MVGGVIGLIRPLVSMWLWVHHCKHRCELRTDLAAWRCVGVVVVGLTEWERGSESGV